MISDPKLGTEFLLALTMPEEKQMKKTKQQKPQTHLILFSRQPGHAYRPSAGQCPQALMVDLVGSSSMAAPRG